MADYKLLKKNLEAQAHEDPTKIVQVIHMIPYTAGQLLDKMEKDKKFRKLVLLEVDKLEARLFATGRG